jgi:hypothetical protein
MGPFPTRFALVAALLAPGLARAENRDVNVIVDMSPAGRKAVHPTPDHPAYYLPTLVPYVQTGDVVAGDQPPSEHALVHLVATELAKQGYLVAVNRTPDLVIAIAWGSIRPTIEDDHVGMRDKIRMNALVLGHTYVDVHSEGAFGQDEFLDETHDDRFYVVVTAYDYKAHADKNKKVILWKAKMSVPSQGVTFDDMLVPLVTAGGPNFGRETINHPKLLPSVPDGTVQVGTPTVKSPDDAPKSPDGAPATRAPN